MMTLSAPSKSDFKYSVASIQEAKDYAAACWFSCSADEIVERESPDGSTVYLYESEAEADADDDGAYAPQVHLVIE